MLKPLDEERTTKLLSFYKSKLLSVSREKIIDHMKSNQNRAFAIKDI